MAQKPKLETVRNTLDPPVPKMALFHQGAGGFGNKTNTPLPEPLPSGIMPPEDSRLWYFVPKAVQRGEEWIQDDTREWFEQKGRKVAICRDYPDHPRWLIGSTAMTLRGRMYNGGIVSEVHMLARLSAGMAEWPTWVPVRLSVRQLQADTAFRLTKLTRTVLLEKGQQAMRDFADRAPGQFIKFVGATFVPKRIESEVTTRPGEMDAETADALLEALGAELQRREREMKLVAATGGNDYPDGVLPQAGLLDAAGEMAAASGLKFGGYKAGGKQVFPRSTPFDNTLDPEITDIVNLEEPEDAADGWD
jgi:hypothetical protein